MEKRKRGVEASPKAERLRNPHKESELVEGLVVRIEEAMMADPKTLMGMAETYRLAGSTGLLVRDERSGLIGPSIVFVGAVGEDKFVFKHSVGLDEDSDKRHVRVTLSQDRSLRTREPGWNPQLGHTVLELDQAEAHGVEGSRISQGTLQLAKKLIKLIDKRGLRVVELRHPAPQFPPVDMPLNPGS